MVKETKNLLSRISLKGGQIRHLDSLIRKQARLEYGLKFAHTKKERKDLERFLDENEEEIHDMKEVLGIDREILNMVFCKENHLRSLEYSNLLEETKTHRKTCDNCYYMYQYTDGMRISSKEKESMYCSLHPYFNPVLKKDVTKILNCRQTQYRPYIPSSQNVNSIEARVAYLTECNTKCLAAMELEDKK